MWFEFDFSVEGERSNSFFDICIIYPKKPATPYKYCDAKNDEKLKHTPCKIQKIVYNGEEKR